MPTADDLLMFFNDKVTNVRVITDSVPVEATLPPAPAVFIEFEPYLTEEIQKVISATVIKSCALDPLPTQILKEFLPELLPFIVEMSNSLLKQGCLPVDQHYANITPRLKKAGADQTDVKKYQLISNLTFMSKIVEKLVYRQHTWNNMNDTWSTVYIPLWTLNLDNYPQSHLRCAYGSRPWTGDSTWAASSICCIWHGWPYNLERPPSKRIQNSMT